MRMVRLPNRARHASKQMKGRPITTEEFERMLVAVDPVCPDASAPWKRFLRGLWLSGLRLSESVRLSWEDGSDFTVDLSGKHPRFRIWAKGRRAEKTNCCR